MKSAHGITDEILSKGIAATVWRIFVTADRIPGMLRRKIWNVSRHASILRTGNARLIRFWKEEKKIFKKGCKNYAEL